MENGVGIDRLYLRNIINMWGGDGVSGRLCGHYGAESTVAKQEKGAALAGRAFNLLRLLENAIRDFRKATTA